MVLELSSIKVVATIINPIIKWHEKKEDRKSFRSTFAQQLKAALTSIEAYLNNMDSKYLEKRGPLEGYIPIDFKEPQLLNGDWKNQRFLNENERVITDGASELFVKNNEIFKNYEKINILFLVKLLNIKKIFFG